MEEELRKAIESGRAVVIAGTGVSVAACGNQLVNGFPVATWTGLLRHGVWYCREIEHVITDNMAEILTQQIDSKEVDLMISAAETIIKRLMNKKDGIYRQWLKDSLGKLEVCQPDVPEALNRLGGVLATLNYDSLLEKQLQREAVTWQQSDKVGEVLWVERSAVLHLHGYYEEPESVILGVGDYEKVKNDLYGETLLRLFTLDRTMIFVGCRDTVEDPNFSHLITWACEALKDVGHRHFILCRESEVEVIRAKLQQKNAHWLYPVAYGKDYSDLAPYLHKLGLAEKV